jgi:hypothetical protein
VHIMLGVNIGNCVTIHGGVCSVFIGVTEVEFSITGQM